MFKIIIVGDWKLLIRLIFLYSFVWKFGIMECHQEHHQRIDPKIKYQPFVLPEVYNKLQIPSVGYVAANIAENKSSAVLNFTQLEFVSQNVTVTMRIKNINDVNERDQEITFAADLILQWNDTVIEWDGRQRFNITSQDDINTDEINNFFKTLDAEFLKQIWKPDIYFEDLVRVRHPEVMSPPITLRLNEITGQIIYTSRLRIQMECEMDFHYYPADTQNCNVFIGSNSYAIDELVLNWDKPFGAILQDCGGPNFDFQLSSIKNYTYKQGYIGTKSRNYSVLSFNIVARRKLSYHIVQTFMPSNFFIIITWLCFLIPSHMIEVRIGISMTTLLTLTSMFSSVRESTPTVSYVRAIDVWMFACIFFVFLTLLEFTVLLWLRNKKEESEKDHGVVGKINDHTIGNKFDEDTTTAAEFKPLNLEHPITFKTGGHGHNNRLKNNVDIKNDIVEFIEKYGFLIFSITFLFFSIIFWSWLLIGSEYFIWLVDREFNCANIELSP